jgi:hypothetical protein
MEGDFLSSLLPSTSHFLPQPLLLSISGIVRDQPCLQLQPEALLHRAGGWSSPCPTHRWDEQPHKYIRKSFLTGQVEDPTMPFTRWDLKRMRWGSLKGSTWVIIEIFFLENKLLQPLKTPLHQRWVHAQGPRPWKLKMPFFICYQGSDHGIGLNGFC